MARGNGQGMADFTYTPDNLTAARGQMYKVIDRFHDSAIAISPPIHPFVEFTGLMHEFLAMCDQTIQKDRDFSRATNHGRQALDISMENAACLGKKFAHIFGSTFQCSPLACAIFLTTAFDADVLNGAVRDFNEIESLLQELQEKTAAIETSVALPAPGTGEAR